MEKVHGTCTALGSVDEYSCEACVDGFQLRDEDHHCYPDLCGGDCGAGKCHFDATNAKFACSCSVGFQGERCDACADGYEEITSEGGLRCQLTISNQNGRCTVSDETGTIRCSSCFNGYHLTGDKTCEKDTGIAVIILAVVLAVVAVILVVGLVIGSRELRKTRRNKYLKYKPSQVPSDAAFQGKTEKPMRLMDIR